MFDEHRQYNGRKIMTCSTNRCFNRKIKDRLSWLMITRGYVCNVFYVVILIVVNGYDVILKKMMVLLYNG